MTNSKATATADLRDLIAAERQAVIEAMEEIRERRDELARAQAQLDQDTAEALRRGLVLHVTVVEMATRLEVSRQTVYAKLGGGARGG